MRRHPLRCRSAMPAVGSRRHGVAAALAVGGLAVFGAPASADAQDLLRGPTVGILGTMVDLRVFLDHLGTDIPVTVQVRGSGRWVNVANQTITVTSIHNPGRPRIRLRTAGAVSYRVIVEGRALGPWTVNVVRPLRKRLAAGRFPERLAAGPAGVWVGEHRPDLGYSTLRRLNTLTGATTWTSLDPLVTRSWGAIAVGSNAVYIQRAPSTITRIDAATNAESTSPVANTTLSMSAGPGALWVTGWSPIIDTATSEARRLDLETLSPTGAVASQRPEGPVHNVAVTGSKVWLLGTSYRSDDPRDGSTLMYSRASASDGVIDDIQKRTLGLAPGERMIPLTDSVAWHIGATSVHVPWAQTYVVLPRHHEITPLPGFDIVDAAMGSKYAWSLQQRPRDRAGRFQDERLVQHVAVSGRPTGKVISLGWAKFGREELAIRNGVAWVLHPQEGTVLRVPLR